MALFYKILAFCLCIFILSCQNSHLGRLVEIETSPVPLQKLWFPELPSQYHLTHHVSIEWKNEQWDFLAVLKVEPQSFRLLLMDEFGMSLLDISGKGKKEFSVLKNLSPIHHPQIVENLINTVRLTFLSSRQFENLPLSLYQNQEGISFWVEERETWSAWGLQEQAPFGVRQGQGRHLLQNIFYDYSEGTLLGFPRKIEITYPEMDVRLEIRVLSLTPEKP